MIYRLATEIELAINIVVAFAFFYFLLSSSPVGAFALSVVHVVFIHRGRKEFWLASVIRTFPA